MKPGRSHFAVPSSKRRMCLRQLCRALIGRLVREQLTHAQYLDARKEITESRTWAQSTLEARRNVFTYLDGAVETLYASGLIVWAHKRLDGEWWYGSWDPSICERSAEGARHVWASSGKVWFEPSGD